MEASAADNAHADAPIGNTDLPPGSTGNNASDAIGRLRTATEHGCRTVTTLRQDVADLDDEVAAIHRERAVLLNELANLRAELAEPIEPADAVSELPGLEPPALDPTGYEQQAEGSAGSREAEPAARRPFRLRRRR